MSTPVIRGKYDYNENEKLIADVVKIVSILNRLNLSRGAIQLLSYYILYGVSRTTHDKFVFDKKVKDKQGVYNLRNELKDWKLLLENEDSGEWEISNEFRLQFRDKVGFQLLLVSDEQ